MHANHLLFEKISTKNKIDSEQQEQKQKTSAKGLSLYYKNMCSFSQLNAKNKYVFINGNQRNGNPYLLLVQT